MSPKIVSTRHKLASFWQEYLRPKDGIYNDILARGPVVVLLVVDVCAALPP